MSNDNKIYTIPTDEAPSMVSDAFIPYQQTLYKSHGFFQTARSTSKSYNLIPTGLQPIIKWPGGKEKELKYILPNAPQFKRYFEPFVGGGSVFMAIRAKEYYINDLSSELVALYNNIAKSDKSFFIYVEAIDKSWERAATFFNKNSFLVDIYLQYRNGDISNDRLKTFIHQFCIERKEEIHSILGTTFSSYSDILIKELEINLFRKMSRMLALEKKKKPLPEKDVQDNIETAIKSAVYMCYRCMYNDKSISSSDKALQCALFFFMRNYSYSGMFRYSSKGEFNVPYGGIAYNSKLMAKKLSYYRSKPLLNHFEDTHIYNLDFELFLRITQPTKDDFVFLDPPYDSEFRTYAQNEFTKTDQERLAAYLIDECKAKWMIIIKNTEFIFNLYNKEGINIKSFDKEYLVSFMNRNDKKVTHLLITNY